MSKGKALLRCIGWSLPMIVCWWLTNLLHYNSICIGIALLPTTFALIYGGIAASGYYRDARDAEAALDMRYASDDDFYDDADAYGSYGSAAPHTTPGSGWIGLSHGQHAPHASHGQHNPPESV